jgi:L-ascorbate metabolism protein UlaG (beta-lactamase superfamily)
MSSTAIAVKWLGNAHFVLDLGEMRITIDPWISGNPGCPITLETVDNPGTILVTHGHPGHFGRGDAVELARRFGSHLIAPESVAAWVLERELLPPENVYGAVENGALGIGDVAVLPFEARHPPVATKYEAGGPPGKPNYGYVISVGETRLLHVGDAAPDEVYASIARAMPIDLAMLPLWSKEMVWTEEKCIRSAVTIAGALGPRRIVPHARYRPEVTTHERFADALKGEVNGGIKVIGLTPGDSIVLDGNLKREVRE